MSYSCTVYGVIYSDVDVKLDDRQLKAHKFVLAGRSDNWRFKDGDGNPQLDLTGMLSVLDGVHAEVDSSLYMIISLLQRMHPVLFPPCLQSSGCLQSFCLLLHQT